MAISYRKLWKLLIDKDMKKKDLQRAAGISAASITKLGKNENVNTEIIEKSSLYQLLSSLCTHKKKFGAKPNFEVIWTNL